MSDVFWFKRPTMYAPQGLQYRMYPHFDWEYIISEQKRTFWYRKTHKNLRLVMSLEITVLHSSRVAIQPIFLLDTTNTILN